MATLFYPFDPSRISEGYGYAEWRGGLHDGIDFAIAAGTDLRSTVSGVVRNNDAGSDGAGIDITTPDGWVVRHWHVSRFGVPNGSTVEAGQVVGLTGGIPGTWGAGNTTGAHLHWGVKIGGKWVNPAELNPLSFDELHPITPPKRKRQKMGAFYRTPDGGILWQEKPNTAFYPLNFTTWKAYAAQGNTYADLSKDEVDVLVAKYGIIN